MIRASEISNSAGDLRRKKGTVGILLLQPKARLTRLPIAGTINTLSKKGESM
jgi:hypothetical protein